jgi:hypothetical protein
MAQIAFGQVFSQQNINIGMLDMVDESNAVVEKTTSIDTVKKQQIPLSEEQLLEIWKRDEYWGVAGVSLTYDPYTGKRTPEVK